MLRICVQIERAQLLHFLIVLLGRDLFIRHLGVDIVRARQETDAFKRVLEIVKSVFDL